MKIKGNIPVRELIPDNITAAGSRIFLPPIYVCNRDNVFIGIRSPFINDILRFLTVLVVLMELSWGVQAAQKSSE
jgi:hypothetical protein